MKKPKTKTAGRPRTGSLALRPAGYAARLSTSKGREWIPLGTQNEEEAQRKLLNLVAEQNHKEELLETYADRWLIARQAAGVVMIKEEIGYWRNHCEPNIGPLALSEVRPSHVSDILIALVKKGLSKQTVRHTKGFLHRIFDSAWRAEIIKENPVDRVQLPKIREVRRERVTLSDEEFTQLVTAPEVDEELRMLAVFSRVLGGMRAGDLHQLDWTKLDAGTFAEVGVPRSKTKTPQRLEIPEEVRPLIFAWWEKHGSPPKGPVFPCRTGERTGQAKGRGTSYARRLRRALKQVGLTRPELFVDTPTTRQVDFHSFRRSFVGALSGAGINLQRAMKLSGHTSARTHASYVVGVQEIPRQIIPALSATRHVPVAQLDRAAAGYGDPEKSHDSEEKAQESVARPAGFEPATNGLEGRVSLAISIACGIEMALDEGDLTAVREGIATLKRLLKR